VWQVDPVLISAMVIGLLVRVWSFGDIPPGLNQDEASTAYDAYALIHHGIDRHGYRFPVVLVSWGSGMYALAAYVAAPFIGLFGLSVWSARLPFFLAGMAALPMFFVLLHDATNRQTARIGVLLLSLCPWHIMISRWGLDSNLFPFVFLVATLLLQRSAKRPRLLVAAAFVYGLALYAYGTAYVVVPAFIGLALVHGLRHRLWPLRTVILSALVFVAVATPIGLYVAVNSFGWNSIRTPFFSIPHLTGLPRFKTMGNLNVLSGEFVRQAWANLGTAADMFRVQDDGLIWNAIPGYGILYAFSPFLALAGLALLMGRNLSRDFQSSFALLAWCFASALLMVFVAPNINRANIAMFPFIYCVAVTMSLLWRHRALAVLMCLLVCVSFIGFARSYFGPYRTAAAEPFFASFGEAIRYAATQTQGDVCVTDKVNMPYIFVLFYNREDPRMFRQTAHVANPGAEFETVSSFGRYKFGLGCCANSASVIIATHAEAMDWRSDHFSTRDFERYTVLVRRE
jgi:MFS family permease